MNAIFMRGEKHVRRLLVVLAWGLLASAVTPAFGQDAVPGRLLVKFKSGVGQSTVDEALAGLGGRQSREIPKLGIKVVELPLSASVTAAANQMKGRPDVEFAEPDYLSHSEQVQAMTPNDPWFANWQYALKQVSCPAAWSVSTGNPAVIVAILDSGIYSAHPDLQGKIVAGYNAVNNNSDLTDVTGHGTLVSGVVGADSNNGVGVASVAWNCMIMPIRVSDSTGTATYSAIATGLQWAADHGAKVANLSFDLLSGNSTMDTALKYFRSKGGLVTVSAGNYGTNTNQAADPYMVTVSAVSSTDLLTNYSSWGSNVDVSAPGTVYSTTSSGGYSSVSGTSFAAPMVAGEAALIWSANPTLTNDQVEQIIEQSADDLGSAGWDMYYGYGRINVARALQLAESTPASDTTAPAVAFAQPTNGSTLSGFATVTANATDNVQVDHVTFAVNGVAVTTIYASPYSFSWDTTSAANGAATLQATAVDSSGNATTTSVSVTVNNVSPNTSDTMPPTVSITSPTGGKVGNSFTVAAQASDNVGVTKVALYVDGKLIASDSSAPWSFSVNSRKWVSGTHTLMCKAYDAAGNVGSSAGVSVSK